jgi:hypothetical protein
MILHHGIAKSVRKRPQRGRLWIASPPPREKGWPDTGGALAFRYSTDGFWRIEGKAVFLAATVNDISSTGVRRQPLIWWAIRCCRVGGINLTCINVQGQPLQN